MIFVRLARPRFLMRSFGMRRQGAAAAELGQTGAWSILAPEAGQREKGCAPPRPGDTCREKAKAASSEKRTPRQHRLCWRETARRKRLRARPSCFLCGYARCGAIRGANKSPPIRFVADQEHLIYNVCLLPQKFKSCVESRIVSPGALYINICVCVYRRHSTHRIHTGAGNFTQTHTNVNLMVHQAESDPTKSAYAMRAALNN